MREFADLPGPRGLPLVGSSLATRPSALHLKLERWADRYGTPYKVGIGTGETLIISQTEAMNAALRDRPDGFRRWSVFEGIFEEIGFNGVFSREGEGWKRQRKLVIRALNSNHLARYYAVIATTLERLHRVLSRAAANGESVDIHRLLMSYSVDITSGLAFGEDINTLEDQSSELPLHVLELFAALHRRIMSPVPYWQYVKLPPDRRLDRAVTAITEAIDGFIANAHRQLAERPELREEPENFLQSMVAAVEEEGSEFEQREVAENVVTLLAAGEDTTANTLAWATWYLATDAEAQRRLAAESVEHLGAEHFPADYESAAGFEYGEAVIQETLRLKPAAVAIFLETRTEQEVAGVRVPAGIPVIMLNRYAATRRENYDRPSVFDPARWIEAERDPGAAHDNSAFLPFGAGPRFCPGRNLSILESKAVLAMIARNFVLELDDPGQNVSESLQFTMAPKGLRLRVTERRPTPTPA